MECPQYSTRLEALGFLCHRLSRHAQRWQVVKVIWHKAHCHRRRMVQCYSTGDGNVSFHDNTLAPPGEYDWICASFSPLESTTQTANRSVKPFLPSWCQKVPIINNGRHYPPELPPSNGRSGPPCNTRCLFGPMRAHNPNGTSIGSAVFVQMTAECPYALQWFVCFPLNFAPSHVGIWTSCNTWFIGHTRVRNQMTAWSFQPFCRALSH